MKKFLSFLLGLLVALPVWAEDLPAFPGAEGFGRYTTGGRGGAVYHVTNLNDNGEGSFRWAVEKSGARTIVFDVAGTIFLESSLSLKNGNVTIAGQTAPGGGICIAGYPFTINASNVIIRFLRFRLGNENVARHEGDGLGGMDQKDIMVDHCSVSWSIDECLSVYGMQNSTVQWCIVSQSLRLSGHEKGAHGYGGNWGGSGASYHHNLMCHHESRTPRLGPRPSTQLDERMDMRNNVIYNWAGNGCYGGEAMNVNIVNNYYKPGPATRKKGGAVTYRIAGINIRTESYIQGYPAFAPTLHQWGKFFVDGNTIDGNPEVTKDNWTKGIYAQVDASGNDKTYTQATKDTMRLYEPIDFYATTTHTAAVAYEKVLQYAGASLSRDALDETMVYDTRNNVATYSGTSTSYPGIIDSQNNCKPAGAASAWPELTATVSQIAKILDSDGDGMPDDWEEGKGLDPGDPSDGNQIDPKTGYTYLEVYMNSLVSKIMDACTADGELEGILKDSASEPVPETEEVELSSMTYTGTGNRTWEFNDGWTISTGNGYAAGTGKTIKFSRNSDFYINIPEGKEVTALKIEAYCNGDGQKGYLQKFGSYVYDATQYPLPARDGNPNRATYTIEFDTPITGDCLLRFSGDAQCAAALTLTVHNVGAAGVEETVMPAKDAYRLVDVYNLAGQCVKRQIPYKDIFTTLPRGFYVVEGEKLILY